MFPLHPRPSSLYEFQYPLTEIISAIRTHPDPAQLIDAHGWELYWDAVMMGWTAPIPPTLRTQAISHLLQHWQSRWFTPELPLTAIPPTILSDLLQPYTPADLDLLQHTLFSPGQLPVEPQLLFLMAPQAQPAHVQFGAQILEFTCPPSLLPLFASITASDILAWPISLIIRALPWLLQCRTASMAPHLTLPTAEAFHATILSHALQHPLPFSTDEIAPVHDLLATYHHHSPKDSI